MLVTKILRYLLRRFKTASWNSTMVHLDNIIESIPLWIRKYVNIRRVQVHFKAFHFLTLENMQVSVVKLLRALTWKLKSLRWFAMVFCGVCIQMSESSEPMQWQLTVSRVISFLRCGLRGFWLCVWALYIKR